MTLIRDQSQATPEDRIANDRTDIAVDAAPPVVDDWAFLGELDGDMSDENHELRAESGRDGDRDTAAGKPSGWATWSFPKLVKLAHKSKGAASGALLAFIKKQ